MKLMNVIKAGALAAVLTGAMIAGAQAQTTLKVSHFLPPNHTFHKTMVAWGAQLEKMSGGKLKLQIYPAGQLGGGPNRQFDAARNGISDIAISLHGVTPGRYVMSELVTQPFTSPTAGTLSAITSRRLTELAPKYLAKEHTGLHILYMAVTPPLLVHSKVAINKIDDFKGVKIRYAGANFKAIVETLGGVPLAVPPQETQDALAKGIVDAATFPYEGANAFRLGTVTKYAIEPAIASASFAVVMNKAKYDSLPPDLKALIDKTTGPNAAEAFGKAWDQSETGGKAHMLKQGVQVIKLPAAEAAKMKKTLAPLVDAAIAKVGKRGLPAREFVQAYTK